MAAYSTSYRRDHEAFVSNLKGTSVGCILVSLAHVPAFILLVKLIQGSSSPRMLRDVYYLIFPLLLSLTVLVDFSYCSLLIVCCSEIYYLQTSKRNPDRRLHTDRSTRSFKSYLSLFKGSNLLVTVICILAVDFRVFPRRFAKTETFGISLMDAGVGTFIVSSAITSRYARGFPPLSGSQAAKGNSLFTLPDKRILQHTVILLLGIGRLVVLRLAGYHEHVTEYGVHWNFFVTLFCVWMAADFLHKAIPRRAIVGVSFVMLIVYQAVLVHTDLTDYILSAPRINFLAANREGVFSLFGFVPLYLIAETIAHHVFFNNKKSGEYDDSGLVDDSAGSRSKEQERDGSGDQSRNSASSSALARKAHFMALGNRNNTSSKDFSPSEAEEYSSPGPENVATEIKKELPGTNISTSPSSSSSPEEGKIRKHARRSSNRADISASASGEYESVSVQSPSRLSTSTPPRYKRLRESIHRRAVRLKYILGMPWRVLVPSHHKKLIKHLSAVIALLWGVWVASTTIQPTSRRFANMAYVFFTLALSMTLIFLILLADIIGGESVRISTLEFFNVWQLPIFVAANLFTGIINMSMRTIYAPPVISFFVIAVYCFLVVYFAWFLGGAFGTRTSLSHSTVGQHE